MEYKNRNQNSLKKRYAGMASEKPAAGPISNKKADILQRTLSLGYTEEEINSIPESSLMGLGCGNPTALAELKEGETVLDLGAGGGMDVFLASQKVGKTGRVIGIDSLPEMVEKAQKNADQGGFQNVRFQLAAIENLPVADQSVDVVISNCVINHCRTKTVVFTEIVRCLKPGGRMLISDLLAEGTFSRNLRRDKVWGEWLAHALGKQAYLNAIAQAGFRDLTIVAENPFYMSQRDDRLKGKIISIYVKAFK